MSTYISGRKSQNYSQRKNCSQKKPREWYIPQEHLIDVLKLYDEMMASTIYIPSFYTVFETVIPFTKQVNPRLPRYCFWQKIQEVLPETADLPLNVEELDSMSCIKIVEAAHTVEPDEIDEELPEEENG